MEVITLSIARGAAFPVTIAGVNCNAFIDTGATRSCTSETFYNQLMLPQLLKAFHLVVTSDSGSTLCLMAVVQCYNVHLNLEDIPMNSILLSVRI